MGVSRQRFLDGETVDVQKFDSCIGLIESWGKLIAFDGALGSTTIINSTSTELLHRTSNTDL